MSQHGREGFQERELIGKLDNDLLASRCGRVLYLEGPTDVDALFGLLGVSHPLDNVYDGVKVAEVGGKHNVHRRVRLAQRLALKDRRGDRRYAGIFGLTDGDGLTLGELCQRFDPPYGGPVFCCKAYSIENLLALTGWPQTWGDAPDWPAVLSEYTAYVALNRTRKRLEAEIQASLDRLGLGGFSSPSCATPLKTQSEVEAIMVACGAEFAMHNALSIFREEAGAYGMAILAGEREAHALLDGKWLVEHLAVFRTGQSRDRCRAEWIEHARERGGLPEMKTFFSRLITS